MLSKEDRLKALELDFQIAKTWASHWQTIIVSGAYKDRKVSRPVASGDLGTASVLVPFTEAELLRDALATMKSHVHNMGELADKFKEEAAK